MDRQALRGARLRFVYSGLVLGLVVAFARCGGGPSGSGTPTGAGGGAGTSGTTGAGPATGAGGDTSTSSGTGADAGTDTDTDAATDAAAAAPLHCELVERGIELYAGPASGAAIAALGDRFAVAYGGGSTALRVTLVDATGKKLGEHVVTAAASKVEMPSLLPASGGLLALWERAVGAGSMVEGRYLDTKGTPRSGVFTIATSNAKEARPVGVALSSGIAVAWMDASGVLVGQLAGQVLTGKQRIAEGGYPALALSNKGLGVAWTQGEKIGFTVLEKPLAPPSSISFRDAEGGPNVPRLSVLEDGSFVVAWEDNRDGVDQESIYLARITAGGAVSPELRVSPGMESANFPDVIAMGRQVAVVYHQWRDGPSSVFLAVPNADFGSVDQDLEVSAEKGARLSRVARLGGRLGVVYVPSDGSLRLSLVECTP